MCLSPCTFFDSVSWVSPCRFLHLPIHLKKSEIKWFLTLVGYSRAREIRLGPWKGPGLEYLLPSLSPPRTRDTQCLPPSCWKFPNVLNYLMRQDSGFWKKNLFVLNDRNFLNRTLLRNDFSINLYQLSCVSAWMLNALHLGIILFSVPTGSRQQWIVPLGLRGCSDSAVQAKGSN